MAFGVLLGPGSQRVPLGSHDVQTRSLAVRVCHWHLPSGPRFGGRRAAVARGIEMGPVVLGAADTIAAGTVGEPTLEDPGRGGGMGTTRSWPRNGLSSWRNLDAAR